MKKGIHPTYHIDAQVTCSCGHSWTTGSTHQTIRTDICSSCHPFYTGEQRIVDTAGQVDRFMKRLKQFDQHKETAVEREKEARQKMEERFLKQQLAALDLGDELTQVLHDATVVSVGDLSEKLEQDKDDLLTLRGFTPEIVEQIEAKLSNNRTSYFAKE
jgi:large subunit ribosomal protein L31